MKKLQPSQRNSAMPSHKNKDNCKKPGSSFPGTRGHAFREPLIFECSRPGRTGYSFSADKDDVTLPKELSREDEPLLPNVSEPDVVRHFTRLSQWNFSIDTNFYPLGSCTMKYNPRINEDVSAYTGFACTHPFQPDGTAQGNLEILYNLQEALLAITGMDAITLQPAAGAQGELAGILMIRAYHESQGNPRKKILIPDSAHGTNPASCTMAGYKVIEIKTGNGGILTPNVLAEVLDEDVAALMLTNPNTLGIFESHIVEVCKMIHDKGGLVYCDGANLNALLGQTLIGDMGVDVLHLNTHKTFATPHGGGGPGSGPVAVKKILEPFLPIPRIVNASPYKWSCDYPHSIGRLQSNYGNFAVLVRAYTYIMEMGAAGLKRVSELSVLNANYIRKRLEGTFDLPYQHDSMHEVVFSDKLQNVHGIKTLQIAKRLMDYGFHPPTIYFPLIVHGALMIEPTETESKETIDEFCDAMIAIAKEAETNPELLRNAPHNTQIGLLDEAQAVKHPKLRYEG
jgi:glycine dehydrogenase subunit 2